MANTFSANSLTNTTTRFNNEVETIIEKTKKFSEITMKLSEIVKEGSPALSNQWAQISETYSTIGATIEHSSGELLSEMNDYVSKTIENELIHSNKMKKINSSLETLKVKISNS